MENYRLIAIDGKPLPRHLRLLDDAHEVVGGELALASDEVRFEVREFRGGRKGDQFVLVATMGPPQIGQSTAETLGGNHSWHFVPDPDGERDPKPV
ncbi:MAG TPA: hypothetical protein VJN70_07860 [Gemmatimonadaceae bacterium]|nr:hypothetical protein [Gemmatimonadaceae bacterium]